MQIEFRSFNGATRLPVTDLDCQQDVFNADKIEKLMRSHPLRYLHVCSSHLPICCTYVIVSVLSSVLKRRHRQRSLQKIPGQSNPSLIWGHWRHTLNHHVYQLHKTIGHTEMWHAFTVFSGTYNLWYLTQRHATTFLSRITRFRADRVCPLVRISFQVKAGPGLLNRDAGTSTLLGTLLRQGTPRL
ncbi:hypothetical protein EDB87DRAFT_1227116 [Lactarius vividus]|nr:hypothetical protein EDB87DRAFT_1227116 [Lactarius vividus]